MGCGLLARIRHLLSKQPMYAGHKACHIGLVTGLVGHAAVCCCIDTAFTCLQPNEGKKKKTYEDKGSFVADEPLDDPVAEKARQQRCGPGDTPSG